MTLPPSEPLPLYVTEYLFCSFTFNVNIALAELAFTVSVTVIVNVAAPVVIDVPVIVIVSVEKLNHSGLSLTEYVYVPEPPVALFIVAVYGISTNAGVNTFALKITGDTSHLAYNVIFSAGIVVNVYGVVRSASLYHPTNVYPVLVGAVGAVTVVP